MCLKIHAFAGVQINISINDNVSFLELQCKLSQEYCSKFNYCILC